MQVNELTEEPGLVVDPKDNRDHKVDARRRRNLPSQASLAAHLMPAPEQVYRTCVPHACSQMIHIVTDRAWGGGFVCSPSHLYWIARNEMGTTPNDVGCTIRDTLKAMHKVGAVRWGAFPGPQPPFEEPNVSFGFMRIPGYQRVPVGKKAPDIVR